ncbi:MAG: hypothetical protein WDW21_00705 [Neisseriaceae bacterium]
MKKHLYILSFLVLFACGDLGNTEKINNLTKPIHIEKNQDYFKNPFYEADDIDNKCFDKAGGDFVEMRNCTYDQIPKIEKEILKKAKLLNKANVYTSSWLAKKEKVINKKCTKKYQNQSQLGDMEVVTCIRDGMYALGKSIGNAEKKVGNTTNSTDIEKNNAENESDNLSEADQIEKNEDFFKYSEYQEDNIDDRCIHKAGDDFSKIANCMYEEANRIQAKVIKRAKLLNKDNIYSSDWVNKKREALKKECTKEYKGQDSADIRTAACLIRGMYTLGKSIK